MTQRHITRYASSSEYDSDFDNLEFPNVSYIDEGDEVRYSEEHPYLITGKSTATSPFAVKINNTNRTVTLDPTTGDWKLNVKSYIPLTSLGSFVDRNSFIKSIDFPKTFDTSNVTSMYHMFYRCGALTSVGDLSNWDTSNVTSMESMFVNCGALTSLPDISGWNVYNVTSMSSMFSGCGALTSLPDISGWNTSNVKGMNSMFNDCGALTSVGDLSNWDTSNVTSMYGMFSRCGALTSLPDISRWNTSNVTSMNFMFNGCRALTSLGIPPIGDGTKAVDTIDMFTSCSNLANIPSCGDIHNGTSIAASPLTLDSAKVILNALSTPYNGAQTLTLSSTTKGYINADSEALAIVAEKQALGWTIAL